MLKLARLRSEKHRRNVSALGCVCGCGQSGPSQAAHANFGKGMGLKACDTMTFPLAPNCHTRHDQSGIPKDERRKKEAVYVDATRAELISRGQWTPEIETAYRAAYEPLWRACQ